MKRTWPAAERNAEVIAQVLKRVLATPSSVLEIASGTGQHAAHFCRQMPELSWQPTDLDPEALPSIRAWQEEAEGSNFLLPILLDVTSETWPVNEVETVYCANMIHISPWQSCLALMQGAARVLASQGALILYGPFLEQDVATAASNEAFDVSLKSREPSWGIRKFDEVSAAAARVGLVFEERVEMPANNLILVFRKG